MKQTRLQTIGRVLLLLCINGAWLCGQDQLRHGGYNKPNVMAGLSYDSYFKSALFDQLSLQLSLAPSILSSLPVIGDSKHLEQGSLLDVTVRLERDTSMHSRVRWKGTLLDFNWTSREYPMDWKYFRLSSTPLGLDPWYHSTHFLAGMTLLSYDRASLADLDARWLAARAGVGGEYDVVGLWWMAIVWRLMAGTGVSTFKLGETNYDDLGSNASITQSGVEANADFALAIKKGLEMYGPYPWSLGLRGDVAVRHLVADLPLSIVTFGVALSFITTTTYRSRWSDRDGEGNGAGIEGILRFERQIVRFVDREQAIERFQIGAQYSFW
jgi:hypothetical protein